MPGRNRTALPSPAGADALFASTQFLFKSTALRVVEIDGEPWFVAADVCACTGLTGYASQHTGKLAPDERRVIHLSRAPNMRDLARPKAPTVTLVSESGLYKLIMRSDKSEAREFQDWVTREVLPAIRKTGGYLLNENARATAHADTRRAIQRSWYSVWEVAQITPLPTLGSRRIDTPVAALNPLLSLMLD